MVLERADIFRIRECVGKWGRFVLPNGKVTAAVVCPTCKHAFSLADHAITEAGAVSPSVVCPWPGCTFHDFVVLATWP